ncbi:hypothetical protein D3C71_1631850 [compost metagenome]
MAIRMFGDTLAMAADISNGGNSRLPRTNGVRSVTGRWAAWDLAAVVRAKPLYSEPLQAAGGGRSCGQGPFGRTVYSKSQLMLSSRAVLVEGEVSGMELARNQLMRRQSTQEQ